MPPWVSSKNQNPEVCATLSQFELPFCPPPKPNSRNQYPQPRGSICHNVVVISCDAATMSEEVTSQIVRFVCVRNPPLSVNGNGQLCTTIDVVKHIVVVLANLEIIGTAWKTRLKKRKSDYVFFLASQRSDAAAVVPTIRSCNHITFMDLALPTPVYNQELDQNRDRGSIVARGFLKKQKKQTTTKKQKEKSDCIRYGGC